MRSEGQSMMFDLLIAVFVFFLVLGVLASLWLQNWDNVQRDEQTTQQRFRGQQALDSLLRFQGVPSNWNIPCDLQSLSSTQVVGLAYRDRVLDENKLLCFFVLASDWNTTQTNYSALKDKLQLNDYEFGLRVFQNGSDQNSGHMSLANSETIVIQRIANHKGSDASVELRLFRKA